MNEATPINSELARRVQDETGQNVYLCYQCVKCTSGCPVAEFFDWQPNQVMRALQLGQEDVALHSQTPWLCASCQTCTTRCPQGLDITAIMEFLTREAKARDIKPQVPEVNIFNEAFMREVQLWGRAYELGLMAEMKTSHAQDSGRYGSGHEDAAQAQDAVCCRIPRACRTRSNPSPARANAIAYYPGCSLHSTATEFDVSTRAVCEALGLNVIEPRGWVCCGSSAAHRADPEAALRLPMENLALVEQSGFNEVTMPCAACFNRHKAAQYRNSPRRRTAQPRWSNDRLRVSRHGQGHHTDRSDHSNTSARRRSPATVKQPLTGLRVVCYYGCLLTRPPQVTEAPHPENPTDMDQLHARVGR